MLPKSHRRPPRTAQEAPQSGPEPSRGGPGPPEGHLERPGGRKTHQKRYTVDDVRLFSKTRLRSRQERFKSRPGGLQPGGGPREAPGARSPRATRRPPGVILERFWTHVSSIFAAIVLSILAAPGQSHAGRPNGGPEKAVEKSFPKSLPSHLQARCAEHMSH